VEVTLRSGRAAAAGTRSCSQGTVRGTERISYSFVPALLASVSGAASEDSTPCRAATNSSCCFARSVDRAF
jgi:hypothetical protein